MRIVSMNCPNCRAALQVDADSKNITCAYCGSALFIDDETKRFRIDDPEQMGYEFEKGRQRAQAELQNARTVPYAAPAEQAPPRKRRTWLWVLGWIFIFPVPLTVLMIRNQKLNKFVRAAIIIAAWLLYFILGLTGNSGSAALENAEIYRTPGITVVNTYGGSAASESFML